MKPCHLLVIVSASAYASPTLPDAKGLQTLQVTFKADKQTSVRSVAARYDDSQLVGQSCSDALNSGEFANLPIKFDVDKQAAGTVTVGSTSYKIHEDPAVSGGITCARLHSPAEALVSCTIQVPRAMKLAPLAKRDVLPCFQHQATDLDEVLLGLEQGATDAPEQFYEQPAANVSLDAASLEPAKRDDCNAWFPRTWRVGNGNPHQNPLNIQLSDNMQCNGRPCSVGYAQARSYSIGWSASVNAFEWISAGFSVQRSIETGNQYTCYGDNQDFLCLWKNQAQTAYTVQNYRKYCDRNEEHGNPFVMWSPNENNRQGYYYCVYGRQYCRAQGDRWLDTSPHRPGGP